MKNLRIVGLCALVALGALAAAQDAMNLKFAPKVGDTFKYKLNGNFTTSQIDGTISASVTDKVTKSDGNGYTMSSTQSDLTISIAGSPQPGGPDQTDTTSFNSKGEILDIEAEQVNDNMWRLAELNDFVYPDKPVKVGDTWTSTVTADAKKGTVAATATYVVDSTEKIGSHDTVKIKVNYKETSGDAPATSDGFVWIDTKDGSMVKGVSTWANVPAAAGMSLGGTFTLERVD
jgi:hypothetical protein